MKNMYFQDENLLKALKNLSFRLEFIQNPKKALKDHFNIEVPDHIEIKIHENQDNVKNFILPLDDNRAFGVGW